MFRGAHEKLPLSVVRTAAGSGPKQDRVVFAGCDQQAAVARCGDVEDVAGVANVVGDALAALEVPDRYAANMIAQHD